MHNMSEKELEMSCHVGVIKMLSIHAKAACLSLPQSKINSHKTLILLLLLLIKIIQIIIYYKVTPYL